MGINEKAFKKRMVDQKWQFLPRPNNALDKKLS